MQQANFVEGILEEGNLFLTCMDSKECKVDVWLLDTRCSNHMTGVKSLFCSIDESVKLHVRLDDDKQVQIEGKGTIIVKAKSSIKS